MENDLVSHPGLIFLPEPPTKKGYPGRGGTILMMPQQAILKFSEAERPFGERLLKIAAEVDRIEGYSEPHAVMIARLSESLGAQMGLHGGDLIALKFAALVHDIGERVMKRNYLLRPSALNLEEMFDLWR